MWVDTSCRLELDYVVDTPVILMLRPKSGASQWVSSETFEFSEPVNVVQYTDQYGNLNQRLTVPAGGFVIETKARVSTADSMDVAPGEHFVPIPELPDDVLQYLSPSRYCESDRFGEQALSIAGDQAAGYGQVANITAWIREHVRYAPGTSAEPCSASEILRLKQGVCKDLAHLGIAMCRSISIPARFVDGYLLGLEPMDLHAWFEAYIGGRWYTFDPTQADLVGARVAIAYGRDAADVAIYHQFGPPARYTDMQVSVSGVRPD